MSCLHVSKRENCTAGLFRAVSVWGFRDNAEIVRQHFVPGVGNAAPGCSASDTVRRRRVTLIADSKMKYASICVALAVIVAPWGFSGQAASEPKPSDIESANRLFEAGKFAEAGEVYARIAAQNPKDYAAILQLGRIALLSNRLDDAQKWLEQAIALQPGDADAKVMLAEAFYRRDDFQKAAAALNGVDVSTNKLIIAQYPTLNVAKMESFKGQTPYEVQGDGQTTRVKFLKTESPAAGQRARQRRRRGHLLHRYRGFGGRARHGVCQGAWPSAIRRGARHVFRR